MAATTGGRRTLLREGGGGEQEEEADCAAHGCLGGDVVVCGCCLCLWGCAVWACVVRCALCGVNESEEDGHAACV